MCKIASDIKSNSGGVHPDIISKTISIYSRENKSNKEPLQRSNSVLCKISRKKLLFSDVKAEKHFLMKNVSTDENVHF